MIITSILILSFLGWISHLSHLWYLRIAITKLFSDLSNLTWMSAQLGWMYVEMRTACQVKNTFFTYCESLQHFFNEMIKFFFKLTCYIVIDITNPKTSIWVSRWLVWHRRCHFSSSNSDDCHRLARSSLLLSQLTSSLLLTKTPLMTATANHW